MCKLRGVTGPPEEFADRPDNSNIVAAHRQLRPNPTITPPPVRRPSATGHVHACEDVRNFARTSASLQSNYVRDSRSIWTQRYFHSALRQRQNWCRELRAHIYAQYLLGSTDWTCCAVKCSQDNMAVESWLNTANTQNATLTLCTNTCTERKFARNCPVNTKMRVHLCPEHTHKVLRGLSEKL